MTITQGPNRFECEDFITSPANHPTYNYFNSLFGGKFSPRKESTAYWTHLRKCFLRGRGGNSLTRGREGKILKICSSYLEDEIKAVQPEFILATGKEVTEFLGAFSNDGRLRGSFEEVFKRQREGLFGNVKIGSVRSTVAVVPHPSGRSRFWIEPPRETKEILLKIQKAIFRVLKR